MRLKYFLLFGQIVTLINCINGWECFWHEPVCNYSVIEASPPSEIVLNYIDAKPVAYCSPTGAIPWNDWITGFSMGAINRVASDPDTDKSTPVGNFTGLGPAVFATGDTATFSISARAPWVTAPFTEYWAVYIDYNHDDDFGDTNELVFSSDSTVSSTSWNQFVINGDFIIPVTADTGTTRLRIVMKRGGAPDPCQASSFNGEVEDYSINIQLGATPTGADLSLASFTTDTSFFHTNDEITFSLVLNNNGPDTARSVTVHVPFNMLDMTFIASSATHGSYNTTTKMWTISAVAPAISDTLSLTLQAIQQSHSVTLFAQVDTLAETDPDSYPGNGSCCTAAEDDERAVTIVVPESIGSDLAFLPITMSPSEITLYHTNTFTFTLKNQGTQAATNVIIDVPFDTVRYAYEVGSNVSIGSFDPYIYRWTLGTLPANGTATLNLVLFAKQDTTSIGMYAQVYSMTEADPDSTPGNGMCCTANEDDEVGKTIYPLGQTPPEADLAITAFEASSSTFQFGDTLAFTLMLSNWGPDTAYNIEVHLPYDTIDFKYLQNTTTTGIFNQSTQKWSIGALSLDSNATLVFDLLVATAVDTLTLTAEVFEADEDDPDSVPGNYPSGEDDEAVVAIVFEIPALTVELIKTDVTINGAANGAVDLVILTEGSPPYSYIWSTGDTTQDLTNLTAGMYKVTVTDTASQVVIDSILLYEIGEVDIVWEETRANVFIDFDANTYEKAYENPTIFFKSCNLLPATVDGWVKFKLLEDYRSNGDWIYVGLVDTSVTIGLQGTQDANFLIGVRADSHLTNPEMDNVILLEKGDNPIDDMEGGDEDDTYMIERVDSTIKYYRNDVLIYEYNWQCDTCSQINPRPLNLQAIFYIYDTGVDNLNKVEVTTSFACEDLFLRYEKEDVRQDSLGRIELMPQGGYPPYSIFWENPDYQGLYLDSLSPGSYKVTVVDNLGKIASEDIHIYKMEDIEWDTIFLGASLIEEDTYESIDTTYDDKLELMWGKNFIEANGSGKIAITLLENLNPLPPLYLNGPQPPDTGQVLVGFRTAKKRNPSYNDAYGFYGIRFNGYGVINLIKDFTSIGTDSIGLLIVNGFDMSQNINGYVFEIELSGGEIIYWKNGKELYRTPLPSDIELLSADAHIDTTAIGGFKMDIKVSFPPLPNTNVYAKLKKHLDGGYVIVKDNKLKFKFIEDYDTPADVNDLLTYTIYDWHREPVTSGPVSPSSEKELGVNWYAITVNLTHRQYYVLEVTDTKGEKYYLRFQYWCPSNIPCEAIYISSE